MKRLSKTNNLRVGIILMVTGRERTVVRAEVSLMRRALVVTVLIAMLMLVVSDAASAALPPCSRATAGARPPDWVQREALWQSLAAREPHPAALQWRLTTAARAAHLAGSATSYLASFDPLGKVYVVVLRGHFRPPDAPSTRARRLFLVLEAKGRAYLAHGCTSARRLHLASLGHLHAYVPRLPVRDGLWGHTMVVGGPFPGGPRPLKNVAVVVWQGADAPASDPPLMQVRSDGAGFFVLKLASGAYTLRLSVSGGGPPAPTTVTVKAGRPVAAGVYEDVP